MKSNFQKLREVTKQTGEKSLPLELPANIRLVIWEIMKIITLVEKLEKQFMKESGKKQSKVSKVMGEYKHGDLHSGSKKGPVVKSKAQATAIALSEARKEGAKIPKKK